MLLGTSVVGAKSQGRCTGGPVSSSVPWPDGASPKRVMGGGATTALMGCTRSSIAVEDNVLVDVEVLHAADTDANCGCNLQIRDKLTAQKKYEACVK